ncbi:hypothetical protein GBA52_015354 [Prunus armeniaca]|nr:hypothetical protein GBA52_015354 [Prunus armeniaca]
MQQVPRLLGSDHSPCSVTPLVQLPGGVLLYRGSTSGSYPLFLFHFWLRWRDGYSRIRSFIRFYPKADSVESTSSVPLSE